MCFKKGNCIQQSIKPMNNISYQNDTEEYYDMNTLLKLFEKAKEKVDKDSSRMSLSECLYTKTSHFKTLFYK